MSEDKDQLLLELKDSVAKMGKALEGVIQSQKDLSYILDPANSIADIRKMRAERARMDVAPKP